MPGASSTNAQAVRVEELDGSPASTCQKIVFPNGSVSISGGVATITFAGVVTPAIVTAAGSSNSGSAGTPVASIAAAAGKRLVGGSLGFVQAPASTSHVRVTLTLADDSTVTADTATQGSYNISASGLFPGVEGIAPVAWSSAVAQGIKAIAVTTLGVGTLTRYAHLSAVEVPA